MTGGRSVGRLAGRAAIVTGGGRGIGRATAQLFASHGAKVLIATRSEGPGREAMNAIVAGGGEATLHVATLNSRVRETIAKALDTFGQIDIIVHNAIPDRRNRTARGDADPTRSGAFSPFLASDKARKIAGQILSVDAGQHLG